MAPNNRAASGWREQVPCAAPLHRRVRQTVPELNTRLISLYDRFTLHQRRRVLSITILGAVELGFDWGFFRGLVCDHGLTRAAILR